MKGKGFHLLKYVKGKGNLSLGSVKGPKGLTDASSGCKIVQKTLTL